MLNILIQETDQFFHRGLQCFFVDFFTRNFKQPIHFDVELSRDNVSAADIIVLPFCMGETHICYPRLQARQKGIVIGVVDDARRFGITLMFSGILLLFPAARRLDRISEVLFLAWYRTQIPGYRWRKKECADCQHKTFSPQQMRMMVNFYRRGVVGDADCPFAKNEQ